LVHQHPEFCKAIKSGELQADAEVAERLYSRATGYSHEAVKIFMPAGAKAPVYAPYVERYPPDTNAASLWLRNRQPDKWRAAERHDIHVKGSIEHQLNQMTPEERIRAAKELGERVRQRLAELGVVIEHEPRLMRKRHEEGEDR
jgi:hypothetical protein